MALLVGIVFAAFLVEAAAGFGSTVIALTVGALWWPMTTLLAWMVPVNLVLSLYLVARGWRALDWRFLWRRLLPLLGVGLVAGTLVAAEAAQARWLEPAFGVLVVALAAWQLARTVAAREGLAPLKTTPRALALVGAGLMHGVYASGGPLTVFVAARELKDKAAFRATLSAVWVTLNVLVLARLARQGALTGESLRHSAVLLLPLAFGIGAGEWVHRRLDQRRFQVAVAALLVLAGATLTFASLRGGRS